MFVLVFVMPLLISIYYSLKTFMIFSVPTLNPNLHMPTSVSPILPGLGGLQAPTPMPNFGVPSPGATLPIPTGLDTSSSAAGDVASQIVMETPAAAPESVKPAAPEPAQAAAPESNPSS